MPLGRSEWVELGMVLCKSIGGAQLKFQKPVIFIVTYTWLVDWIILYVSIYWVIGNNNPIRLIFFRGVETTSNLYL